MTTNFPALRIDTFEHVLSKLSNVLDELDDACNFLEGIGETDLAHLLTQDYDTIMSTRRLVRTMKNAES